MKSLLILAILASALTVSCGGDSSVNNEWPNGNFGDLNGRLLYSSGGKIYQIDLAAVTITELFPGSDLTLSADGELVYVTEQGLMMSGDASTAGSLLVERGVDQSQQFQYREDFNYPVVSPDGMWIAYQESTSGQSRIHIVSADDGDLVTSFLSAAPSGYQYPVWLGQQIVMAGTPGANGGLWSSFAPGFETLSGYDAPIQDATQMVLSHDGQNLLYVDEGDIYSYNLFAETSSRVTETPGIEQYPAWSPDDRWVAARSDGDITLIEIDGEVRYSIKEVFGPLAGAAASARIVWYE